MYLSYPFIIVHMCNKKKKKPIIKKTPQKIAQESAQKKPMATKEGKKKKQKKKQLNQPSISSYDKRLQNVSNLPPVVRKV